MTASGDSVSKHAARIPGYLCEQMTVGRMVEALEALHFNKREQASLVLDPGVQNFLIRAAKAPAADPNQKVRHAWRGIKAAMNGRRFPPPWSVGLTSATTAPLWDRGRSHIGQDR